MPLSARTIKNKEANQEPEATAAKAKATTLKPMEVKASITMEDKLNIIKIRLLTTIKCNKCNNSNNSMLARSLMVLKLSSTLTLLDLMLCMRVLKLILWAMKCTEIR